MLEEEEGNRFVPSERDFLGGTWSLGGFARGSVGNAQHRGHKAGVRKALLGTQLPETLWRPPTRSSWVPTHALSHPNHPVLPRDT